MGRGGDDSPRGTIGTRLSDSLRASPELLAAVALLLAGWLAAGGLPAFARACEIFALAIGFAFALIVFFGMFHLQWDHVILWRMEELAQVPVGSLSTAGTLAAGCYLLFLIGDVRPEAKGRRNGLLRLAGIFLLLTVALLLVLGRLGAELTGHINRPFFQMVSGLGFEGAFQRLEELVSSLWVLGDAALLGMLLLSLRRLLALVLGRKENKRMGWCLTGLVFLLTLPVWFWNQVLSGYVLPVGNLIAGGILVCLLWFWSREKENQKNFEKGVDIWGEGWYYIQAVANDGTRKGSNKRT